MGLRKRIALIAATNFLMYLAEGLIAPTQVFDALEAAYEIIVPSFVLKELERIAASAPQAKIRRVAKRALDLLGEGRIPHKVLEAPSEGDVDDSIIQLSLLLKNKGFNVVVATSDRELRKRLRRAGVPTLYYRESSGELEVDWLEP